MLLFHIAPSFRRRLCVIPVRPRLAEGSERRLAQPREISMYAKHCLGVCVSSSTTSPSSTFLATHSFPYDRPCAQPASRFRWHIHGAMTNIGTSLLVVREVSIPSEVYNVYHVYYFLLGWQTCNTYAFKGIMRWKLHTKRNRQTL